jgi:hypothetical protein
MEQLRAVAETVRNGVREYRRAVHDCPLDPLAHAVGTGSLARPLDVQKKLIFVGARCIQAHPRAWSNGGLPPLYGDIHDIIADMEQDLYSRGVGRNHNASMTARMPDTTRVRGMAQFSRAELGYDDTTPPVGDSDENEGGGGGSATAAQARDAPRGPPPGISGTARGAVEYVGRAAAGSGAPSPRPQPPRASSSSSSSASALSEDEPGQEDPWASGSRGLVDHDPLPDMPARGSRRAEPIALVPSSSSHSVHRIVDASPALLSSSSSTSSSSSYSSSSSSSSRRVLAAPPVSSTTTTSRNSTSAAVAANDDDDEDPISIVNPMRDFV